MVQFLSVPLDQHDIQSQVLKASQHGPANLPSLNPTRSFWLDSPNANPLARKGSDGDLTCDADVCIIGSGITGVSAAYHLSRAARVKGDALSAPLSVTILEAREFCSGATGRNGGHFMPYMFYGFRKHAARHGTEQALRLYALERHTVNEIQNILETEHLSDAVDFVPGGRISLFFSEQNMKDAQADYFAAKNAGMDLSSVEWIDRAEMLKRYGTGYPGIKFPSHNLWPLKLVTKLYQLTESSTPFLTLNLHTCTPVTSIHPYTPSNYTSNNRLHPRRWVLTTPRGHITCRYVIHATNAYASHLLRHLSGSGLSESSTSPAGIIPVRGQVIAIRATLPLQLLTQTGWDANEGFEYWFPRPVPDPCTDAPLIILGGGREAARPQFEIGIDDDGILNPHIGIVLRKFLPEVFPEKFVETEPEMEWTGIMGFSKSGYPLVGPVPHFHTSQSGRDEAYEGQYIAAAYNGHGMTRAFACAEVVVGMLLAEHTGETWVQPDWFPYYYLTRNSGSVRPCIRGMIEENRMQSMTPTPSPFQRVVCSRIPVCRDCRSSVNM